MQITSERKELSIKKLTITGPVVDVGAAAAKAMPPGVRHRYYVSAQYEAEDGTVILTTKRAMTKPKLKAEIESTHEMIAKGCYFAGRNWDDSGWSISMRLSLSFR